MIGISSYEIITGWVKGSQEKKERSQCFQQIHQQILHLDQERETMDTTLSALQEETRRLQESTEGLSSRVCLDESA